MKNKRYVPISLQSEMEYKEYVDKLTDSEREFIERFYEDLYANGIYRDNPVIKDKQGRTDAIKNYNSHNRDALNVAKKNNKLDTITEATQFMEDACDEWDWRRVYDQTGYKDAALLIFDQTIKELENKTINIKITLNRFYEKMNSLKRLNGREKKHKRKQKR
jgi:hypothetical protein